jgi:hypothetical protein
MTGEVPGLLSGWFQTVLGDWLACGAGLKLTVDQPN